MYNPYPSRNPSEIQRWTEENNVQLEKYQNSRNMSAHHQKVAMLRVKINRVKRNHPPLGKSGKQILLNEINKLADELGFDLGSYNSSDWAATIGEARR